MIAIGYGDGYPRSAPSGTPVWINGRKVPIVGRVSMADAGLCYKHPSMRESDLPETLQPVETRLLLQSLF